VQSILRINIIYPEHNFRGITVTADSVEADYLGCGSWYPAEVISAQNTGSGWSYSVRYSDGGEEETGKSADGVRGLGGTGGAEYVSFNMSAHGEETGDGRHTASSSSSEYDESEEVDKHDGLVTLMCRLGLGSDDEPHLCVHQMLACIGQIYKGLYDGSIVAGQSSSKVACRALLSSLLGEEQGSMSTSSGNSATKDHLHALASSYYNQALVCALAEEKKQSSHEYTAICFELENVV
jgi:hypothetical protein